MNSRLTNALLGLGALLMASQVNAATTFSPEVNVDGTLENVDFFYLSVPSNYTLGLFDANDTTFTTPLMVDTGNAVSFSPNTTGAGSYTATNDDQPLLSIPIPTTLGGNAAFILGMQDTNTGMWFGDSGATDMSGGAGKAFNVSFTNGSGEVLGVDMILAVPVPAAVWLFGSGLIGLVGVARRKRA